MTCACWTTFSAAESRRRAAELCELPRVTLLEGDVRDPEACRRACAGADYVLHHAMVASDDALLCADVNVGGTVQMLEAARAAGTVQRFVCASSGAVYGDTPATSKHEAGQVDPLTPEASSLLAAEGFCRSAFRRHGLQTVCLRYFNVYGPGRSGGGRGRAGGRPLPERPGARRGADPLRRRGADARLRPH